MSWAVSTNWVMFSLDTRACHLQHVACGMWHVVVATHTLLIRLPIGNDVDGT